MRNHSNSRLLTANNLRHPISDSQQPARGEIDTTSPSSMILLIRPRPLQAQQQQNPIFETTIYDNDYQHPDQQNEQQQQYAMNMDISYGYPNYPNSHPHRPSAQSTNIDSAQDSTDLDNSAQSSETDSRTAQSWTNSYLSGPLVVRVKPDGSPVEEDRFKPLPKDDDLELFGNLYTVSQSPTSQTASYRSNRYRKRKDYYPSYQQQQPAAKEFFKSIQINNNQ